MWYNKTTAFTMSLSWDTLRLLGAIEIHCNRAVYVSLNTNANPNPDPKWA